MVASLAAVGFGVWAIAPAVNGASPAPPLMGRSGQSRDAQLTELRTELERVRTRREALGRELDEMDGVPALREAEAVARAAQRHGASAL